MLNKWFDIWQEKWFEKEDSIRHRWKWRYFIQWLTPSLLHPLTFLCKLSYSNNNIVKVRMSELFLTTSNVWSFKLSNPTLYYLTTLIEVSVMETKLFSIATFRGWSWSSLEGYLAFKVQMLYQKQLRWVQYK